MCWAYVANHRDPYRLCRNFRQNGLRLYIDYFYERDNTLLIRLFALLALLWTGKHIVQQVSSKLSPHQHSHETAKNGEQSDDMVKDPVCQTYIPKSLAIRQTRAGTQVYFCSEECAAKFAEQQQSDPS